MLRPSAFRFEQIKRSQALGGRHLDVVQWDLLARNARLYGGREALVDMLHGDARSLWRRRTWAEAYHDVNTLIFNLLDRGMRRGGLVVSHLPNCLESIYLDWATSKLGAMHCGLNVDLGPAETLGVLEKLQPDVAIIVAEWHGRDLAGWYRRAREKLPGMNVYVVATGRTGGGVDDMASTDELFDEAVWSRYGERDLDYLRTDPLSVHELLPTAGTTSIPKISCRTSLDWLHVHGHAVAARAGHTVYDTRLVIGPVAGGSGRVWAVHTPLITGGRTLLPLEFDEAQVCRLTEEEGVTLWVWNPALITRVVTSPAFEAHRLPSLRQVASSGAPMPEQVTARLIERGIVPFNLYGTSEVGGCMCPILPGVREEHLRQGAGVPLEGYDVVVVGAEGQPLPPGEVGEILIWNIHHGYFDAPDETALAFGDTEYGGRWEGYQHTGDLGVYDEHGYLRVVGRKKDMILRGGQNIFPKEIEDVLSQHPMVRDIAIVAMPDPVLGERACAFVVPREGARPTVDDFAAFLEARGVAKFKWPERVELLDAMPLGPGGKILKAELRARIAAKLRSTEPERPAVQ
jgi:acyl-CoA synthetase (AMP-forming)/AMP-acid ligase II